MNEYNVSAYASMLRDRVRVEAFRHALESTVTSASQVLEIGTGVGYLAVVAARLGASSVTAVELGDIVYLARSVIESNRCEDRVTLLQGDSRDLDISHPFDIVVSDLRGVLPWYGDHLRTIDHARIHLLADGGSLIPQADEVRACLVADASLYDLWQCPWDSAVDGVNLSAVRPFALNSWGIVNLDDASVTTGAASLGRLDYRVGSSEEFSGSAIWGFDKPITLHGVAVWADIWLSPGLAISNAPGRSGSTYGQAFFPLEVPLTVRAGDRVKVRLDVCRRASGYDYRWTTTQLSRDGAALARIEQSTPKGRVGGPGESADVGRDGEMPRQGLS